jgi:uridine kinase
MRIALHLKVLGLNPVVLAMDNYFVDRELTPKDENGNYDFECLGAMDLELLNN